MEHVNSVQNGQSVQEASKQVCVNRIANSVRRRRSPGCRQFVFGGSLPRESRFSTAYARDGGLRPRLVDIKIRALPPLLTCDYVPGDAVLQRNSRDDCWRGPAQIPRLDIQTCSQIPTAAIKFRLLHTPWAPRTSNESGSALSVCWRQRSSSTARASAFKETERFAGLEQFVSLLDSSHCGQRSSGGVHDNVA